MFFNGIGALAHTLVVGVIAYAALVVLLRFSGKRTLAKWNAFDLIVTVAFGSTLATALLSRDTSAVQVILAFAVLIALQFVISWTSVRIRGAEQLVKSQPALLVYRGSIQSDALRRERVTEVEVRAALRLHGVADTKMVDALILETDGSFSLIEKLPESGSSALKDVKGVPDGLGS
ncbi:MAG: YetF domain-containing protein [Gemmatimonadota bacterium]